MFPIDHSVIDFSATWVSVFDEDGQPLIDVKRHYDDESRRIPVKYSTDDGKDSHELASHITLYLVAIEPFLIVRKIPKSFSTHPRIAAIDLYYSFWTVDAFSGGASTFTLEPVPLEFQGELFETR